MTQNSEQVKVTFADGSKKTYNKGTTLLEISKDFIGDKKTSPIMAAIKNGKFKELFEKVEHDSEIQFIDLTHVDGFRVYQRSLILIFVRSIYDTLGTDNVKKVRIKHSINKGLYCEIDADKILTSKDINNIESNMKLLVEQDIKIEKRTVPLDKAMELFEERKMIDKVKLFKYRRISSVNLYKVGWFEDYLYGFMAPSTGCLKYFKVIPYDRGLILQMPARKFPHEIPKYEPFNKLFNIFQESKRWSSIVEINSVGALNDAISRGQLGNIIRISEALQEKKIAAIADNIVKHKMDTKVILIAGPSSSGKTTFAQRLSIQLRVNGVIPHPISIDDYFVNRENTPLDEHGDLDFESIYAIDIKQFNEDLTRMLRGEKVEIPSFNFRTGRREYKGHFIQLNTDDVLVIEGIHGLNEMLTSSISKDRKYKIYISALTQLNIDDHNRIPTTDGRLLRRIVRDNQYRGTSAEQTISMWQSVRRGEEKNIFPFQEQANIMFNSAHIYELAVLKPYAEPLLFNIKKGMPQYFEAKRLIKFLDYFLAVSNEEIPMNSILREFIGGSCFRK